MDGIKDYLENIEKQKAEISEIQRYKEKPICIAEIVLYILTAIFYLISGYNFFKLADYGNELNMILFLSGLISGTFFLGIGKIVSLLNEINFKLEK